MISLGLEGPREDVKTSPLFRGNMRCLKLRGRVGGLPMEQPLYQKDRAENPHPFKKWMMISWVAEFKNSLE